MNDFTLFIAIAGAIFFGYMIGASRIAEKDKTITELSLSNAEIKEKLEKEKAEKQRFQDRLLKLYEHDSAQAPGDGYEPIDDNSFDDYLAL